MIGWILSVLSVAGTIMNARKMLLCWPVWLVANTGWTVLAYLRNDMPQVALWTVYNLVAIYGWWHWTHKEEVA